MLETTQIDAIREAVVKVYRERNIDFKWKGKDKEKPGYTPVYNQAVDIADSIRVHADLGSFPTRLFKKKAPNEDDAQWEYRMNNYRAATRIYWNRAEGVFNRVWNEQNYVIDWPDKPEYKEYFEEEYPKYKSLVAYFESVVTQKKLRDANAVLLVRPFEIPTTLNDEGQVVADDATRISPVCKIYGCERVVAFAEGQYCMVEMPEKSWVDYNGKSVQEGLIYEFYNDTNIYHIVQTGKKIDYRFETVIYYPHNLGKVPAFILKGKVNELDEGDLYEPPLHPAVPHLDEALYDYSTKSISKVASAFPHKWAFAEPCNHCTGNGYIYEGSAAEGNERRVNCKECGGTGRTRPFGPTSVIEIKPPTGGMDSAIPTPPGGYIHPDTDVLDFLQKEYREGVIDAFANLNIDVSRDKPTGDETATGRLIDREELHSAILIFSNEIFDLLKNAIECIGLMRWGAEFKMPIIAPPVSFAMRDEADLTTELKEAIEAKLPNSVRRKLVMEYIETRFTNNAKMKSYIMLQFLADALFALDEVEIMGWKGLGLIEAWQCTLHLNIESYIAEFEAEDKNWMDKPFADKKAALIERAKADTPKQPGRSADDILNGL